MLFFAGVFLASGQCTTTISTFPYLEGFESGTANWVSGGTNNDWAWGSPSKPVISSAGNGTKCWIIGGTSASFYNFGERSWVQSPCFDLSAIDKPFISFLLFWDSEYRYDGANVQYSINGGTSWFTIGNANEPPGCNTQNWYNIGGITNLNGLANSTAGWAGNTQSTSGSCQGGFGLGAWVRASHCVPQVANQAQVMFRFTFGSGTTCNDYDGFAFDDFYVGIPPAGSAPIDIVSNCSGTSTISFSTSLANCFDTYQWNFGDPSSTTNTSATQSSNHTFSGNGLYTISLTASGSCISDTSISKQVRILDGSIVSTAVTCVGDSNGTADVTISGSGPSTVIEWNTNPVQNGLSISQLPIGTYNATIKDTLGCSLTLNTTIGESPFAHPSLEIGNDLIFCPGSPIPIVVENFQSYLWQDGSTDSVFLVNASGKISLTVSNSAGCKVSDSLNVIEDCLGDILFPNAFTPNEDGINEVFIGVGSIPENFNLKIYNRWGEVIFETNNFNQGWDGKYKDHFAHDGIYVYQANFTVSNNDPVEKTGRILLIR